MVRETEAGLALSVDMACAACVASEPVTDLLCRVVSCGRDFLKGRFKNSDINEASKAIVGLLVRHLSPLCPPAVSDARSCPSLGRPPPETFYQDYNSMYSACILVGV
jgi:hypothetical protein